MPPGVLTAGAWDDNRNYDFFTAYLNANSSLAGQPPIAKADRDAANALFSGTRPAKQRLDVAIVIDTTGSMGDEASYLKTEFENISTAIATSFPLADQHWALVAYRDTPATDPGDAYVVESFDFTASLSGFGTSLGGLSAGDGGDYPESPDLGLARMNTLAWRADGDVARLAFWVADAPQHSDKGGAMAQDFADAHQKDIHIYPVAASGADELTELTMRSGAQLTGGRYLFLTDDSGIGDPHKEPSIPCYFVTKLASAIVRMVSIELSGVYREPDPSEIIRTGGDPQAGVCSTTDGGTLSVF
ncbi:MAG TPA: VWA domain-containing protein [Polyangiaceae bacterium]|nr:VWA domain-containing protein [Polyangiaceae bacterium]